MAVDYRHEHQLIDFEGFRHGFEAFVDLIDAAGEDAGPFARFGAWGGLTDARNRVLGRRDGTVVPLAAVAQDATQALTGSEPLRFFLGRGGNCDSARWTGGSSLG